MGTGGDGRAGFTFRRRETAVRGNMENSFVRKLEFAAALDAGDRARLLDLTSNSTVVEAHEDVVRDGTTQPTAFVVLEGLACTHRILADGSRQIFAFLLPGDSCDIHRVPRSWRDTSVTTFVRSRIARVSAEAADRLMTERPNVARALWETMLVEQSTMRERLVSLGRRPADRRLAHLFCELLYRMRVIGLVEETGRGASFDFAATQPQIADAMGLTAVHVNRTLQQLRDAELVSFRTRRVVVLDEQRLSAFAGFDARYLHVNATVPQD